MMTRLGRHGDAIAGAVLAALGFFIFKQALSWDVISAEGPGPGFFPLGYGVAIFVLSVVLCIGSLMRSRDAKSPEARDDEDRSGLWPALLAWSAFAVSIGLMPVLGFFTSLAALTFVLVLLIFKKSWQTAAVTAVLCGIGFYLVFPLALGVELPIGRLGL